ncbi:MFS multidrug transporter [Coprinopsis cinerea AmutBmut pab1-1]|nr:MFS multidrug transporter [Coprinopsis cinerea AmutBmut pab1-1]
MSLERPPSSIETRSLLEEAPPSYHSTDDVSTLASSVGPHYEESASRYSRGDLCWMLTGLWSGVLLGAFDGTVVATLLTPIGSEFNASNRASYIGTSYLLSVCCFTPLYGRLADILGRKGAMLVALSLFGSGTILCGAATSMTALIAARTIAGMGGGGVMTVSSVAVTDLIPLEQRGIYQGIANVLYGLGAAIGGPFGGYINDNFGWRVAFYMQAPFFVFAIAIVAIKVNIPLSEELQNQPLATKNAASSFYLQFPCEYVGIFYGACHLPTEIPDHSLPTFKLYNAPLYFTAVRLENAAVSAIPSGSLFAGWLMRRTGKLYGLTTTAAFSAIVASFLASQWSENTPSWHFWVDLIPSGCGMASLITSTLIAMITSVLKEDQAVATGITYLFRTTGQVLGRIEGPGAREQIIQSIRRNASKIPELEPSLRKAAIDSVLAFLSSLPIQVNSFSGPKLPPSSTAPQTQDREPETAKTRESNPCVAAQAAFLQSTFSGVWKPSRLPLQSAGQVGQSLRICLSNVKPKSDETKERRWSQVVVNIWGRD